MRVFFSRLFQSDGMCRLCVVQQAFDTFFKLKLQRKGSCSLLVLLRADGVAECALAVCWSQCRTTWGRA